MFSNDYIIDQINMFGQMLRKLVYNTDSVTDIYFNQNGIANGNMMLRDILQRLIISGKINQAENLLFNEIEEYTNLGHIGVALWFYGELNSLSDEKLKACNFSREEISEGLTEIQKIIEKNGRSLADGATPVE